jgi:hypothetical protein
VPAAQHVIRPVAAPGRPQRLSDAEVVCLAVARALLGARSEHHWLRLRCGGLGPLSPYLPSSPGYHKRVKAVAPLICQTTMYLATLCPSRHDQLRLCHATRCARHIPENVQRSELAATRRLRLPRGALALVLGLKLYLLISPDGMPVA